MVHIHIAIALWAIFAALRWGDWKNFKDYYPTLLFVIACHLLYKVFAFDQHHIWRLQGEVFLNHLGAYLLHVFVILPMAIFVYLSTYPVTWLKQCLHIIKWILIFVVVELIGWKYGRIAYHHGWTIWWSGLFNLNMFIVTRIHYKHYLWALPLGACCTFFFLIVFDYV
ncbi:CBO0543 family protein [Paenibacillus whitsoniae]|uniref:Uncharacterized protein n=1 Tax=Paenibacillus whitsoniae TaxID=2496558 RepID=A0A3S0IDM5_9BACL|nr:CBO0543 family protein [Paenibacillus whitsoniae]RTE10617.1 hypothetical protein EJQ19_04900 [Paenibacillus whitsoniae]